MSKTTRDEAGGPAIDELLITASPYGMRAAAVAAGRPVAFFIEPRAKPSRIGDLHVARPLGRMKGIDACIVDIGEGEEAFLQGARSLDADGAQPIVQVVCDAYEGKRARVTRRPVLAGRFATFRPGGRGLPFPAASAIPRRGARSQPRSTGSTCPAEG